MNRIKITSKRVLIHFLPVSAFLLVEENASCLDYSTKLDAATPSGVHIHTGTITTQKKDIPSKVRGKAATKTKTLQLWRRSFFL